MFPCILLGMQETSKRYELTIPVTTRDPKDEDDSSLYGEVDGDAPINGIIRMVDSKGRVYVPKSRNDFREHVEKNARKLVRRKLKQMKKERDASQSQASSRASTPFGENFRTFHAMPEASYGEKMRGVADFAEMAREQLSHK